MAKVLIIFIICLQGFVTDTLKNKFEESLLSAGKKCLSTLDPTKSLKIAENADKLNLQKLKKIFDNTAKSEEVKCFTVCVMKEIKMVDADGNFVREGVMENLKQFWNGNEKGIADAIEKFDICDKKTKRKYAKCDDYKEFHECIKELSNKKG